MLTWRDIRVRYKQSVMGFFWAILMPAVVVGAGILVRMAAAHWSGTELSTQDVESVMLRAVVWSFVITGIRFGTNSLIANPNLVTKLAFPKEVFPISAVLSNLFDFLIAFVAVVIVLLLLGWLPTLQILWAVPLLAVICALTSGLSLFLSAANLFFRDVKYLVEVLLTYAIFFTPVLYDASALGRWKPLVMLNPISPLLEGMADSIVYGRMPDLGWLSYSVAASLGVLLLSYGMFKRLEPKFAESL